MKKIIIYKLNTLFDIIFSIEELLNKIQGFFSPLPIKNLDKYYIDPKKLINVNLRNNYNNIEIIIIIIINIINKYNCYRGNYNNNRSFNYYNREKNRSFRRGNY